jgi:hypothetical protein
LKLYIDSNAQPSHPLYLQEDETFDKVFDPQSGIETVSLWVTPNRFAMFDLATKRPDAKGVLAHFACCWIGRAADLDRCHGCGVRQHDDGRIEVRLRFGPPWWWNYVIARTASLERTVDPVRQV